jgi:hypothetical protein
VVYIQVFLNQEKISVVPRLLSFCKTLFGFIAQPFVG